MRKSKKGQSFEKPRRTKQTEHVNFTVTPDMKAAIKQRADFLNRRPANYIQILIREDLIRSEAELTVNGFPFEQSLELWVWAKQQAFEAGAILPMPQETLCEVRDGSKIIRFDFEGVDGNRYQILDQFKKGAVSA